MPFCKDKNSRKNTQPKKEKKSDISESDTTILGKKEQNWRILRHRSWKKIEHSKGNHCKSNMIFIDTIASGAGFSFSSCQNMITSKDKKFEFLFL